MTSYKTPGVYVEEIVKFPPSVAQVETAIPAFIGYTEKATNKIKGDLKSVPTRITSMLEYETFFGYAKAETTIDVTINDVSVDGAINRSIIVDQPTAREPFLMYYSMQMYFANGGGPCYIVSVGRYGSDVDASDVMVTSINNSDDFVAGLAEVRKVDEPTLLLFPDATALSTDTEFYDLYEAALMQCNQLQDRFTIIDTRQYDGDSPTDPNIGILRNEIGLGKDYLKYGAAYYPFLKTILNFNYDASVMTIAHNSEDSQALSGQIATTEGASASLATTLASSTTLLADLTASDDIINPISGTPLLAVIDAEIINQNVITASIMSGLNNVVTQGGLVVTATAAAATAAADDEDPDTISDAATAAGAALTAGIGGGSALQTMITDLQAGIDALTGTIATKQAASTATLAAVTTIVATIQAIIDLVDAAATTISNAQGIDTNGALDGQTLEAIASLDNELYNVILTELGNLPLELPPSSAIAGVYARVDSSRGVWKAPANVGLSYVIEPSVQVSHDDQKDLNVDVVAGKSINAIRTFTGKGVLVWGARTLAGNDNEWRYVPVRRFFNMVEESVKKATEQFVFEPNDANTWVRIKAMISNFLTSQWRAGALAGPTPESAFYVNIGLGETMTGQDILEGNMIVEIGMAAVRPAEFIVLRFSHKMQEA
jgi:phage tail sheath protein FI